MRLRLVRRDNYLRSATEAAEFGHSVLERWPGATQAEAAADALPTMVHVTCQSQHRRLLALLKLDQDDLADMGTPFVRIGYDEFVWLAYFSAHVPKADRFRLLQALTARELIKLYRAERDYFGFTGLRQYGFLREADDELESKVPGVLEEIEHFRRQLNWPGNGLREPSTSTIAKQLGVKRDYNFYSTAPSQFMHFSAQRLYSGLTLDSDGKGLPRNSSREAADSGFALGWTTYHLLKLLLSVESWSPSLDEALSERFPAYKARATRLLEELNMVGLPPLLEAHELIGE